MSPSSARTEACACGSEQGAEDEHAVPLPVGDTTNVVIVAARDAIGAAAMIPTVANALRAALATRPYPWPVRVSDIMAVLLLR
jgi:hypothetical protein